MKLYVWKHKDMANRPANFYPLSKTRTVGPSSFMAIACHAFFRRKDALAHLDEIGWSKETQECYELVTVEIK